MNGKLEKPEKGRPANDTRDFFRAVRFFTKCWRPNTFDFNNKKGEVIFRKQECLER